jgi:FlaA1/EpsC-like NDP-sugar epimerase
MSKISLDHALRSRVRALRRTTGGQAVFDAASWVAALYFAAVFRYEFAFQNVNLPAISTLCAAAIVLQFGLGRWSFNLYRGRYRIGSFHEVKALAVTVATTAALIGLPVIVAGTVLGIPRSTLLVAFPVALTLMGGARYLRRWAWERGSKPSDEAAVTLIYGAGYLANFLIPQMLTDPLSSVLPVGIIDDSVAKSNFSIAGVPVL